MGSNGSGSNIGGGGGKYGGGGPGGGTGGKGGDGYFRIMWGPSRSYPTANVQDLFMASELVQGTRYVIAYSGDTDWTALGAPGNAVGTNWTVNVPKGTGSGTGSASVYWVF
jgi:hypothetical protein